MLTFKRLLAASSAVVLGAGSGFATSVYAQVAGGPPSTAPGNPPLPAGASPQAQAQDEGSKFRRDASVTVMQHPREGYEARGIRVGTLMVYPKVNLGVVRDDNIFASSTNEVDDTIWRVQPEVQVVSDWLRHALTAYARGSFNRHQDFSSENTEDYSVGASGRLDVSHDTLVNGTLDFTRSTEPRSSSAGQVTLGQGATSPVQYDVTTFNMQGRHEFNKVLVIGRFQSQNYDYSSPRNASGVIIDQSFRNRTVFTYGGRLDYAISPKTAIFVDVGGQKNEYDHRAIGDVQRDSKGGQALVGVDFEITNLVRGDIGVGYRKQTFDAPGVPDLKGFSTAAKLEWLPTQLTTVTLSASRTVEDSPIPQAPGYLSTNLTARVDHELLRNVVLTGQVGWGNDKYTGAPVNGVPFNREDRRKSAGLAASYLINRTLGVSVTYDYSQQRPHTGGGPRFDDNRVGATLTVQY